MKTKSKGLPLSTTPLSPLSHPFPTPPPGTKGHTSPERGVVGEEGRYSGQITVLGIQIDKYAICDWCHKKRSVFDRVAYLQPCEYCRDSKKYQDYKAQKDAEYSKHFGMDAALNANKPAAIWEGRGRQVITNSKGNVIANVPYKRRPLGKKGTKI